MSSDEPEQRCWICMDDEKDGDRLVQPCGCPRSVHKSCIARWQLQKAGTSEETHCRFCNEALGDWKEAWNVAENRHLNVARMGLNVNGQIIVLEAKRGPDGQAEFEKLVRKHLGYSDDVPLQFSFEVKAPVTEDVVTLSGMESFSSAMTCALHHAFKRKQSDTRDADSRTPFRASKFPRSTQDDTVVTAPATGPPASLPRADRLRRWLSRNPPPSTSN